MLVLALNSVPDTCGDFEPSTISRQPPLSIPFRILDGIEVEEIFYLPKVSQFRSGYLTSCEELEELCSKCSQFRSGYLPKTAPREPQVNPKLSIPFRILVDGNVVEWASGLVLSIPFRILAILWG